MVEGVIGYKRPQMAECVLIFAYCAESRGLHATRFEPLTIYRAMREAQPRM